MSSTGNMQASLEPLSIFSEAQGVASKRTEKGMNPPILKEIDL
jgi:hypothetical protein